LLDVFQNVKPQIQAFLALGGIRFHQHVYVQLLLAKIPKAQKDSQVINVFLSFWDRQA